jgi:hypothetical protein
MFALALSEFVYHNILLSLSSPLVARFYLREFWACSHPTSSFEVVGFFSLCLLLSKPSISKPHLAHVHQLCTCLYDWVLAELESSLAASPSNLSSSLRDILLLSDRLPASVSSRHAQEQGLLLIRKILATTPGISAFRDQMATALDCSAEDARSRLFPLLMFKAKEATNFRRFLPKLNQTATAAATAVNGVTLVYEALPPMVTELGLSGLIEAQVATARAAALKSSSNRVAASATAGGTASSAPSDLTIVLDLDETLVHFSPQTGLLFRPDVIPFLRKVAAVAATVVIFTAATEDYGHWAICQLEAAGAPRTMKRLFRQHAIPFGGVFLKDLSRLGVDVRRAVIVDNVKENFALQPGNGIEVKSWFGEKGDKELGKMGEILEELALSAKGVEEFLRAKAGYGPKDGGGVQGGLVSKRALPSTLRVRPH